MSESHLYLEAGKEIALPTPEAFEAFFDEIRKAEFTEFWICFDREESLGGLTNGTHCMLNYFSPDHEELKTAVNQGVPKGTSVTTFWTLSGCGETSVDSEFALPIDVGLEAALQFFRTRKLPSTVVWEAS